LDTDYCFASTFASVGDFKGKLRVKCFWLIATSPWFSVSA